MDDDDGCCKAKYVMCYNVENKFDECTNFSTHHSSVFIVKRSVLVLIIQIFSLQINFYDRIYLKIVKMTVGGCRNIKTGDVQDDLLSMSRQDSPLTLVSLLESHRFRP